MPDGRFEELERTLLNRGVAPLYVERTILELGEHYADLERDALAAGMSSESAAQAARVALGSEQAISAAILARPELLDWAHRWPRVASCLGSAVRVGAIAEAPVIFCLHRAPDILRWSVAAAFGAAFMDSLATGLNWMITLP